MKGSVRYSPPKKPKGGGPLVLFLRCRGVGTMWDEDLSHILAWTCRDLKISAMGQRTRWDEDLVSKIF